MKTAVHEPVRVFLVDDHPLLRTGLRFTLGGMEDLDLIGEASDGFEGVDKILKNPPDIALIDIDLPGISGITVIEMVKKKLQDIKIIALSSYSEKSYVTGAMEAGADGYMLKAKYYGPGRFPQRFCPRGEPRVSLFARHGRAQ